MWRDRNIITSKKKGETKRHTTYILFSLLVFAALALPFASFVHLKSSFRQQHTDFPLTPLQLQIQNTNLLKTLFLYIPLLGFLLGLFFSLIPHNHYSYVKKYFPVSLFVIVLIQLAALLFAFSDL